MDDTTYTLEYYKRCFAEDRDLLADNRRDQQIDDDYYHGYQLTSEERRILQKRKQPDTVFNRYRKSINGTLGVLESGATDPRAYGRNPGVDEDSADVASKVLRFVADQNDFPTKRLECAYDYLVPGHCAMLVEIDEDRRPKLTQIRWEEFVFDARSRAKDFSDARRMSVAKWLYADTVQALYPDQSAEIENALSTTFDGVVDDTMEDRPRDGIANWIDRKHRRLMVVEMYHREGDSWYRCVFHAGGILEKGPSPYLDEKKKPACAIIAQSCYVDRENNRMGVGRDLRSPQDEFNKRRQKLLHMLNNRQIQASDPMNYMPVDPEVARDEASRPDGVLPPGWTPTSVNDLAAGQFNLLSLAESELDRQGPNPAVLARGGQNASGRAKLADQQAGLTEDAVVYKGIHSWEIRVYRAMWLRCRQYWQQEDYIRVTDDEQAPQFIPINKPVMGPPQVVMGPDGMATIQPTILGYENALAELDVDIELDVVPDTAALMDEQFQTLAELAKFYPNDVTFDDLLEVSRLPDKRKLIEKRKARQEQAGQMGQMQQQIAQAGAQAEIENTQADTMKKKADAGLTVVKAQTEMLRPQLEAVKSGFQAGQSEAAAGL